MEILQNVLEQLFFRTLLDGSFCLYLNVEWTVWILQCLEKLNVQLWNSKLEARLPHSFLFKLSAYKFLLCFFPYWWSEWPSDTNCKILSIVYNVPNQIKLYQCNYTLSTYIWFLTYFRSEAALQSCSYKKVFWKYASILLKSHFGMGALL